MHLRRFPGARLLLLSTAAFCLLAVAAAGCAETGGATVTGQNNTAITGNSTTNVIVAPSLALGDKVAQAAADAAKAYMGGLPSAISDADRAAALDKGVDAGLDESRKSGHEPSDAEKSELKDKLKAAIDKYKKQ